MGSENRFVYNPSTVDIMRSKFQMNSYWKGAIWHGDLVPLEVTRIIPGDSAKYSISAFIRTATPPIAPFMDTIRLSFAAFYVPERLVWAKEKEFLGENTEGYGIQSEILAPRSTDSANLVTPYQAANTYKRSFGTYLGLVRQKTGSLDHPAPISVNPIRCILQCYNDWFRNENFMPPYLWNHSETGDDDRAIATLNGSYIYLHDDLPKVCKQLDRFTSCLPWAQKGSPIVMPLGDKAPVIVAASEHDMKGGLMLSPATGTGYSTSRLLERSYSTHYVCEVSSDNEDLNSPGDMEGVAKITRSNLVADLSEATAASINELRLAFATQRYLEALARSGSKYREYIKGIFGVNIGDTTAQMAEYLGGFTMDLNVDQVLQSTGYVAGTTTTLGAPGASSTSAGSDYLFTKSFTEPGYLIVFAYTKHNRTYGQGIDEIYQKHEILEEYNPKFANIGEQAIKSNTLYFTGEAADDDDRFGFQEAYSEYRFKKDFVCSVLSPSNSNSLNFWSLAENFTEKPTLNAAFLTEDRTNIARCLAAGENGPDYFLDVKFNREFVRPMPLYSIPGLVDHH